MTRVLHVSKELTFPPDFVTSTAVIYGGKGMGKTNLGSVIVEELARAQLRFAVLDAPGVWWGLRFDVSGKGPGIEVLILGGVHGDIPIEPTGGAVVADLVADEDASVVVDISRRPDGTMWSISERVRFVTDYCKRLYQRQGEKRRPVMQLIDEAARFIPQIVRQGEQQVAACMGAIAAMVEEGRNVGIGVTLITQRSARLNKDVAELADAMISFRTVGPNSRRAVLDWLGEHIEKKRIKELDEKLRALPRGTALVVSPGWLEFEGVVHFRERHTFDSSATPKPGEEAKKVSGGAKPDLSKYAERMKETIERVAATDPRALQKKVAELQAQVKKLEAAKAPAAKVVTKEVYVLKEGQLKRIEAAAERARQAGSDYLQAAKTLAEAVAPAVQPAPSRAATENRSSFQPGASEMHKMHTPSRSPPTPVNRPAVAPRAPAGDREFDGHLKPAERRILEQAAAAPNGLTKHQLGIRARYRPDTGHFGNMLSALQGYGVLVKEHERYFATDYGKSLVPLAQPLIGIELREKWRHHLAPTEWKLLSAIIDSYPNGITKEDLAAATGYRADTGHFGNLISTLTGGALVEKRDGRYGAMEEFFVA